MKNNYQEAKDRSAKANQEAIMKIEDIVAFRSCLTCVYRKLYPPTTRNGQQVFHRFFCSLAIDSLKDVVRPEDECKFWKGVILGID
jgi:hypothetical protein